MVVIVFELLFVKFHIKYNNLIVFHTFKCNPRKGGEVALIKYSMMHVIYHPLAFYAN